MSLVRRNRAFQARNPKSQAPGKSQIAGFKFAATGNRSLGIGASLGFGYW